MRVAVLMGGASAEREVSLASGVQVARALRRAGHEVTGVDPAEGPMAREEEERLLQEGVGTTPPDPRPEGARDGGPGIPPDVATWPEVTGADVVFVALHGGPGEDGTVQALLDLAGVTYAGSGHLGCALAMDKDVSKRLFRHASVPTSAWTSLPASDEELEALGFPVVVKPTAGGSTLGLTVVDDRRGLDGAERRARSFGDEVMAEAFVEGREITVGVVDGEALPVGEIVPEHEIFDYECKYQPGMAEEIFPADIPDEAAVRARELALRAHRALKLSGFSRVDFVLDGDGESWCLEANALPGMTSTSLLPQAAAAAGIEFPELCDRIVRSAVEPG